MKNNLRAFFKAVPGLLFLFVIYSANCAPDPVKGKQIFQQNCTACHKLGEKLVGPNLIGVKARWNNDLKKISAFVHNPSKFIETDPYVKKLYAETGTVMTPQTLTEQEVADVIEYVDKGEGTASTAGTGTNSGNSGNFVDVPRDNNFLKFLFWGIVILAVIVFSLSYNLVRGLSGRDKEDHKIYSKRLANIQNFNAFLFPVALIIFFGGIAWELSAHVKYFRPEPASDIGVEIDRLFNITLIITAIVFVLTQVLLFYYSFRYRHREGKKAYFYPHNNTIEFIWTSIPAVVLAAIILYGFKTWRKATNNPDNNPLTIEAFARQFDWTFRYPGKDGKLGRTNFMMIDPANNPLGIDYNDPASRDDYTVTELHLPKGRDIYIKLRSQDVIHAVYLPHFRMQMYAQPGMDNRIRFMPTITTAEMRKKINRPEFNYELACNQLCGAAHFNMRRLVVVETQNEFDNWQKDKKASYENYKSTATALK